MPEMSNCAGSSPGMNGCIRIICWSDAASQEYLLISSLESYAAAHLDLYVEMNFIGNIWKTVSKFAHYISVMTTAYM